MFALNIALSDFRYAEANRKFAAGDRVGAFTDFLAARATWPVNRWYRESVAISMTGINSIPADIAVDYIRDGLRGDPASPLYLWLGVLMGSKSLNRPFAERCLYELGRRYPNWPQTKNAREIYDFIVSRTDAGKN